MTPEIGILTGAARVRPSASARACRYLAAGFLLVTVVALHGCLNPPALMPAEAVDFELAIDLYPAGTERVEIQIDEGTALRGFFVPADERAPVVLHLLESSGSSSSLKLHGAFLAEQLVDLGFASLFVDYTGIGASAHRAEMRRPSTSGVTHRRCGPKPSRAPGRLRESCCAERLSGHSPLRTCWRRAPSPLPRS